MEVEQPVENQNEKTRTSWVWRDLHFTPLNNGKKEARCNHCSLDGKETVKSFQNGTNPLTQHLSKYHMKFRPGIDQESPRKKQKVTQLCVDLFHFISVHLSFFRSIMTAICHIPLLFVEKESFRKFMEIACPSFQIPNRFQLRNHILEQAHLTKEKVHFIFILFLSF